MQNKRVILPKENFLMNNDYFQASYLSVTILVNYKRQLTNKKTQTNPKPLSPHIIFLNKFQIIEMREFKIGIRR